MQKPLPDDAILYQIIKKICNRETSQRQSMWSQGALLDHTSEEQVVSFVTDCIAGDSAQEARVLLEGNDGCSRDQSKEFAPPNVQSVTAIGALCLWTLAGRQHQVSPFSPTYPTMLA